ncbi:MAG: beta strand repeat-containing protein, partial [Gemmataceae bacterium]
SSSTTFNESTGSIQFYGDLSGGSLLGNDVVFAGVGAIKFGSMGQNSTGTGFALQDIEFSGINSSTPDSFLTGKIAFPTLKTIPSGNISAQSISTQGGVRFLNTVNIPGTQTYNDAGGAVGDNNISLAATGDITMPSISAVNKITLNTTGTGQIILGDAIATGLVDLTHGGNLSFTGTSFIADSLIEASNPSTNITTVLFGANTGEALVQLTNGNFLINNNVTLTGDLRVRTQSGNGSITFSRTVDSSSATRRNLSLESNGVVTFGNNLGATQKLGRIAINETNNQTLQGLVVNGTISASSFSSGIVANDINILQQQTYDAVEGLSLTTTTNGGILGDIKIGILNTTFKAGLTLKNSGTVTFDSSITVDGAITQLVGTGGGANSNVVIGAPAGNAVTIVSNTGSITFNSPVNLIRDTTLQTTNQDISINGSLNSSNTNTLTVLPGTGATTFGGNIGAANPLGSIV